jgi:hypothetical protein
VAVLSTRHRVLVDAVLAELKRLAATSDRTAGWARIALGQLDWLGQAMPVDDPVGTRLAAQFQAAIAGEHPLLHDMQHYGEAAIIALASRAQRLRPLMLSDDYNARVAASKNGITPVSVHKLLYLMIRQGRTTADQAAAFAAALASAKRAQDYTAAELASGQLGRVGRP